MRSSPRDGGIDGASIGGGRLESGYLHNQETGIWEHISHEEDGPLVTP